MSLNHRDPAGFEIVPGVLAPSDVSAIADVLNRGALERSRAGARHLMCHAAVSDIARDPRLLAIAGRFLGTVSIPFRATFFDKSRASNWLVVWHQDTALPLRARRDAPGWGPWSVKGGVVYAHAPADVLARVVALRVHLDDSGTDNGPLRVLPGTHTFGVLSDAEINRLAREVPAVDCVAAAGGVVAMRPLILHGSSKAQSHRPRRVLHIEYADTVNMEHGLELAIA